VTDTVPRRGRPAGSTTAVPKPELNDEGPAFKRGIWVRCERIAPSRGTWRHYEGKVGRIVVINRDEMPLTGRVLYEYGVKFTGAHDEVHTWFLKDELVSVPKPKRAVDIRLNGKLVP
jgi:hypothetical protein